MAMNLAMPTMLGWVLGGNIQNLSPEDRLPYCNIEEAPKAFDQSVRPLLLGSASTRAVQSCKVAVLVSAGSDTYRAHDQPPIPAGMCTLQACETAGSLRAAGEQATAITQLAPQHQARAGVQDVHGR